MPEGDQQVDAEGGSRRGSKERRGPRVPFLKVAVVARPQDLEPYKDEIGIGRRLAAAGNSGASLGKVLGLRLLPGLGTSVRRIETLRHSECYARAETPGWHFRRHSVPDLELRSAITVISPRLEPRLSTTVQVLKSSSAALQRQLAGKLPEISGIWCVPAHLCGAGSPARVLNTRDFRALVLRRWHSAAGSPGGKPRS